MHSTVITSATDFMNPVQVNVETLITNGLPNFRINGMPYKNAAQTCERIRSAIRASSFKFPRSKVRANLSPLDINKKGTHFDLPVALSILQAYGIINKAVNIVAYGELNFKGDVAPSKGIIQFLETCSTLSLKNVKIITPTLSQQVKQYFKHLQIIETRNLREAIYCIKGNNIPTIPLAYSHKPVTDEYLNLDEIKGHSEPKRALMIAIAGKHSIMFSGPTGTGKSLLAQSATSLLPTLSSQEVYELNRVYNLIDTSPHAHPAFIKVSPSTSFKELYGNPLQSELGAISLATHGILYAEEFNDFSPKTINTFRASLESQSFPILANSKIYNIPTRFQFIASTNLCPCAKLGSPTNECTCNELQIQRYKERLSNAITERIDIHCNIYKQNLQMPYIKVLDTYKDRIKSARNAQEIRLSDGKYRYNSDIHYKDLIYYCPLRQEASSLLSDAIKRFNLTARQQIKVIQVSRTIADIEGVKEIEPPHILEALSYRKT